MLAAALLVLFVTFTAGRLGARLSGFLAMLQRPSLSPCHAR
jgi:hypothetical protein